MAQEESVFGCSYSSGGGAGGGGRGGSGRGGSGGGGGGGSCRSKKIKPKKVPQRGLGVAQLEKIRIEEEQKRESLSKNSIASPPSSDATSFLGVQKFISPFHNSPPPPPPQPSSSSNLSSPNAVFRHSQSAPNIEILQENNSSVSKPSSSPRLWGGDYNLAIEKQWFDQNHLHHQHHHAFAFDPHGNLPPPHHFQPPPPPPSPSMVQANSSSGISPSSILTSHLEPPSNQSSRHHNYASHSIEEDKIVGTKRSYPFSLESPPPHSLHCDFRPSYASPSSRTDMLALCSSGYAESRNKCIRVSPLFEHKPDEAKDNERLNGDFLTLAPPSSNFKHIHQSEYGCRSSQEYGRSEIQEPESTSGSVKQSFSFFSDQRTNDARNINGEEGDTIDLDLKL